jgi:hypothetical protein
MKKAIITLVVLVGLLASATADITLGGDVTFGVILDGDTVSAAKTATADVKAAIDDYNYAQVTVKSSAEDILLESAYVQTKLGDFFMMDSGIGITTIAGYTSRADNSYVSTSQYGVENVANAGVGTDWIMAVDVAIMSAVTIRAGIDPLTDNDFFAGIFTAQTMGDASFAAEVFYDANAQAEIGDGNLIVDGEFKLTMGDIKLDLGAGIRYEMPGSDLYWGVGLGVDYGTLFGVAFGITGDPDGLGLAGVDLTVDPIDLIDLRAAVKLSLAEGADMFQGADIAVIFNVGAVDIYAGYLVTTLGAGNTWAPAATTNGGPYIKFDIDLK